MSTLTLDKLLMYPQLTLVDIPSSTYLLHLVNVVFGITQSSIFERRWKFLSIPAKFNPFRTKVQWHGAKAVAQPLCSAAVASQGCLVAFAKSIPVYSYSSTYYVYIAHRQRVGSVRVGAVLPVHFGFMRLKFAKKSLQLICLYVL